MESTESKTTTTTTTILTAILTITRTIHSLHTKLPESRHSYTPQNTHNAYTRKAVMTLVPMYQIYRNKERQNKPEIIKLEDDKNRSTIR